MASMEDCARTKSGPDLDGTTGTMRESVIPGTDRRRKRSLSERKWRKVVGLWRAFV
jgi:hypothetical protein